MKRVRLGQAVVGYAPPPSAAATIAATAQAMGYPAPPASYYATPTTSTWVDNLTKVMQAIQAPLSVVSNLLSSRSQAQAATEIAKSQIEAQKAAIAISEAETRLVQAQIQQEQETKKILTTEAWKKISPYAIPTAVGLAIVAALLLLRRKK